MNAADLGYELYNLCQRDEDLYDIVTDRSNIESIGGAMIYLSDELDSFDAVSISSTLRSSKDEIEDYIELEDEELRRDIDYVRENEVDFFLSEMEDLGLLESDNSLYRPDGEPPFPSYIADFQEEDLSSLLKGARTATVQITDEMHRQAPRTFGYE